MDIYLSCLIGGALALAVLALCGVGFHQVGIHSAHSHVGHGHAAPTAGHDHSAASARATHHSSNHTAVTNRSVGTTLLGLLAWLSPIYLCAAIVGFGATGTLVSPILHGWLQLGAALAGAYLLCSFAVRPILSGIQNWASLPAKTLGDALLENGTAVTDFDSQGYGLVRLHLDGQVVQLLGQLVPEEQPGPRVRTGETLFVRSVDSARQRCLVSRAGASVLARR